MVEGGGKIVDRRNQAALLLWWVFLELMVAFSGVGGRRSGRERFLGICVGIAGIVRRGEGEKRTRYGRRGEERGKADDGKEGGEGID